jgi:sugar-specific transcriptional regulator TrmB
LAEGRVENEDSAVSGLQVMGLNLYESRAYLALLGGEQLSAKQIGQAAMIPQSRTYDVLESLAVKGFALATPSSPKLYTPVPFERVLPSQYQAKKEEIQKEAAKVQEEAQAKLDELTGAFSGLLDELKNTRRSNQRVPEAVWMVEGRDNIERTIVSMIQESRKDIMRITRPPDFRGKHPPDPFYLWRGWRYASEAVDRGVRVRWLSLVRELPSYPGLGVTEPPERRFLERDEDIIEKFFMADGNSVLLNLYDPRLSAFGSTAMLMHSEAACTVFREHFDAMWERAKPLREVLPVVRARVSEVCAKMSEVGYLKAEVTLYKVMADIGACTEDEMTRAMRKKKFGEVDVTKAFAKLLGDGIVHQNKPLRMAMVENPSNVIASIVNPNS